MGLSPKFYTIWPNPSHLDPQVGARVPKLLAPARDRNKEFYTFKQKIQSWLLRRPGTVIGMQPIFKILRDFETE